MARSYKYARVLNGVVVEVMITSDKLEDIFHESVGWIKCQSSVEIGWIYEENIFSGPREIPNTPDKERLWRNSELYSCDIEINKLEDTEGSNEEIVKYRMYRVKLRDWPTHEKFPDKNYRPLLKE